jgi:hypothetical protein
MSDRPAPLTDHQKREIVRLKSAGRQHKEIVRLLNCTYRQSKRVWEAFQSKDFTERRRKTNRTWKRYQLGLKAIADGRKLSAILTTEERMEIAARALRIEIEEAKAERATAPIFRITAAEWVKA